MTVEMVEKDLSYRTVGVAMEVHRKLGPGLDELHYHRAMLGRFRSAKIHGRYKARSKLFHIEQFADGFETDFLVEDSVILELKHLDGSFCPEHFAQIISYLKHWNCRLGMLIDFGKESLIFERVVYTAPSASVNVKQLFDRRPDTTADRELFDAVCGSLTNLVATYGLGYRETTYRALVQIDLQSLGLRVQSPTATIRIDQVTLGDCNLPSVVINSRCVVSILALQDALRAADRAIVQTYLKHLNLNWGILINFGKKRLEAKYVWLQ